MTSNVGLRSERGPVLLAIMLSTALVALDSTIIATAVPSIVDDLGGFNEFPWLFSVYLLAQAVTVPVYGKLADLFGRKPLLLMGIGLFLVGSIMCGVAWNMTMLIVFRAVQGLGAGAVQPMSITVIGDIYTVEERARVQGYVASMWGAAAVVGPTLGGVFSEYVSWRWIFFVNIPLCLVAATMIVRSFHERTERGRRPVIDYTGAALLTGGLTLVVLGILEGGQSWAWASVPSVVVLGGGVVLLVSFVVAARRSPEPVLPLWVFGRRLLTTSSIASLGVGAVVIGLSSYVPTYVQDVLGTGPVVAGFALATLTVGWPLAASQAGRLYLRIGFRDCALIGGFVVIAGAALLLLLGRDSHVWQVGVFCFVIGLGMGLLAPPTLVAAQASVAWHERGVVTGMNLFARSLGSAVGIAVFGAIANASVGVNATSGSVDPALLTTGVQRVFVGVLVLAVLMTAVVTVMPRDKPNAPNDEVTAADEAATVAS